MMSGEDLFGDLPPPTDQQQQRDDNQNDAHHHQHQQPKKKQRKSVNFGGPNNDHNNNNTENINIPTLPPPPPAPAPLKSALKRPKPSDGDTCPPPPKQDGGSEKKLRFKTTTDASIAQIIEAMQKIASHIKNPAKFSKASKLAIQLIQSGSVKDETSDHFFAILEAAMLSPTSCHDASIRSDYLTLFSAAQEASECLNKKQRNQLAVWAIRAVVANDLYTDDSFVFSKTAGQIKDLISSLPVASKEEDAEEAAALKDEKEMANGDVSTSPNVICPDHTTDGSAEEELDPFGLDALISSKPKKDEKVKEKKGKGEQDESNIFLRLQREALINCLEIAAKRYRTPWCQTVIDILVKHAIDNVSRFTSQQRDAIDKLWASIREQHNRRKNGKSVSGKLDVTAFESLQEKYSHEKISIRRAVGGGADRKCLQWLG